jgi:ATP-dependent Clp protease, protease subunit
MLTPKITQALKRTGKVLAVTFLISGVALMIASALVVTNSKSYVGAQTTTTVPASTNDVPTTQTLTTVTSSQPTKTLVPLNLSSGRVIQLFGVVDEDTARYVVSRLGELNQQSNRPITLIINSPGGSVIDGALIVDAIESSPAKVNTLCVQLCASMAAFIHQYGEKRMVLSHSILMFHPASGGAEDDIDRMVSLLTTIQRLVGKMELNTARRVGLSFTEFKRRSATQIWIDGEDAVNTKFADQLVYVTGNDASRLFAEPLLTDKIKKTRFVGEYSFKNLVVTLLGATLNYLKSTEKNDLSTVLRRDFGDYPSNNDASNSHPLYKNYHIRW